MTTISLYLAHNRDDPADFSDVLTAMTQAYRALRDVQQDVLRSRADQLHWKLVGLAEGSTQMYLEAAPGHLLPEDVDRVVETFRRGVEVLAGDLTAQPKGLSRRATAALRDLAVDAARGSLAGFSTGRVEVVPPMPRADSPSVTVLRVPSDDEVFEEIIGPLIEPITEFVTTLTGEIRVLNMQSYDDRFVWILDEVTGRRLKAHYPPRLQDEIAEALNLGTEEDGYRRIRVTGTVRVDSSGQTREMNIDDLTVIPRDRDLASLTSLIGILPGMTGGQPADEWVRRNRASEGLPE